jgi:sodium/hydrogen exchanger-like protein 6/7
MHSLPGNGKRHMSDQFRRSSPNALDSDEEDNEVLPSANSSNFPEGEGENGAVWRDGQWFNVLDEQYLLPVFSNAVASRRQASRKAMRSTARAGMHDGADDENETERDLGSARSPVSPWQSGHQGRGSPDRPYQGGHHG